MKPIVITMIANILLAVLVTTASMFPSRAGITKADFEPLLPPPILETRTMWVTAYSSTPEETDDTPFITASGTTVRDGIVATNELPMGTKIKIPAIYGEKVFVVEDRMHERMVNKIDVWMPEKHLARKFGITRAEIVVLEN